MVHRGSKYFVWTAALALLLGLTVTPAFAVQGSKDTATEKDSKSRKKKKKSSAEDAWDAKSKQQAKKAPASGQADTKSKGKGKGKSKDKTAAAGQQPAAAPSTLAPAGQTPAASGDQPKKKSWFSKKEKSTTTTPPPASGAAPSTPPPAPAGKGAPGKGSTAGAPAQPGQVWVNLDSGVYHRGGRWYGKTKNGKFMSEADAIKAGYKEDKTEAKKKR